MYIFVNDFLAQRLFVDIMHGSGMEIAMRGKRSMMLRAIAGHDQETDHRGSSTMRFPHSSLSEAAHTSNNSSIATRTLTL
jgi:hypothetical protein